MIFVIMVVLFPVIQQEFWTSDVTPWELSGQCNLDCRFTLVESIPYNLTYPKGSPKHLSTYLAWKELLKRAEKSLDIASFYWTLRGKDVYSDPSDWQGEDVFRNLVSLGKRKGVKIRIAQNIPEKNKSLDTKYLADAKLAQVRCLNFTKWFGSGILHTKFWIVDNAHFYIGSANMDWRALTQIKELGALVTNCPCLAYDLKKIFEVYWIMSERDSLPRRWPLRVRTKFNATNPWQVSLNGTQSQVYFSSSPPEFCPKKRESDISAILKVIQKAKKFVHVAVMDYDVATLYSRYQRYWPVIDDALRSAAYDNGVNVKLLCSKWNHTHRDMYTFLKSLSALNPALHRRNASIEVKLFEVPSFSKQQASIPFARVNHNKYMVTDNTAYIGTSNWAGSYFISTAGVGLVISQSGNGTNSSQPIVDQLEAVFQRDWKSVYAHSLHHYEDRKRIIELFSFTTRNRNSRQNTFNQRQIYDYNNNAFKRVGMGTAK